jgi:hypothetical protein
MGIFRSSRSPSEPYSTKYPNMKSKRKHHMLPWIDDPTKGMKAGETIAFRQRHEANTIELFFDLFFVANLTTFTAYHSILDLPTLAAYIGFFAFIWSTWFQITLHDVRFSRDSLYERTCKVIQMIIFASFALIGSKFQPGSSEGNNTVRTSNTLLHRLFGCLFSYLLILQNSDSLESVFLAL